MGPNYSISTACATSNFCILNSANHIIKGEAVSILHALGSSTVWQTSGSKFIRLCLSGCNALWWLRCSYHSYRFKFILLSVLEFLGYMFLKHMCTYKAGLGGFVACRALSQRNNDPTKASRPWDSVSFNTFLSSLLGIVLETLYRVFANRKRVRCVQIILLIW